MGRSSDTRTLTRAAAAKLVSAGHRAHAITVDLIYAEIKQGSRTTINDELKVWKDEQAKVGALSAVLPEPVANSMLAVWAMAVEHAETVFAQQREAIEAALDAAESRAQTAEAALAGDRSQLVQLTEQLRQSSERESILRAKLDVLQATADAALERAATAQQETLATRADAQAREAALNAEHERNLAVARAELASHETKLRVELRESTARLEGVQKHVMLQVTDARELQRRAEDTATKATQRAEKLAAELQSLRAQLAELVPAHDRTLASLASATAEVKELRMQRNNLKETLANTTGQLEAAMLQFAVLSERIIERLPTRSGEGKKRPAERTTRTPKKPQTAEF